MARTRKNTDAADEALWWRLRDEEPAAREALARKYMALAITHARSVKVNLDDDDRQGAAGVALVEAIDNFDPARGLRFNTYLQNIVRGRVLDVARGDDHLGRRDRQQVRRVGLTHEELAHRLGRTPTDEELADEGITAQALAAVRFARVSPGDQLLTTRGKFAEWLADVANEAPARAVATGLAQRLRCTWALAGLDIESAICVYLHFVKDVRMREVGHVLRLSEPRVSQMTSAALNQLHRRGARVKEVLAG